MCQWRINIMVFSDDRYLWTSPNLCTTDTYTESPINAYPIKTLNVLIAKMFYRASVLHKISSDAIATAKTFGENIEWVQCIENWIDVLLCVSELRHSFQSYLVVPYIVLLSVGGYSFMKRNTPLRFPCGLMEWEVAIGEMNKVWL